MEKLKKQFKKLDFQQHQTCVENNVDYSKQKQKQ